MPGAGVHLRYRALRMWMRQFGTLRSTWYFGDAVLAALRDSSARSRESFTDEFTTPDPYSLTTAIEQERHHCALEMIRAVHPGGKFVSALEIGCAEGHFTSQLADLCHSLMGVDFADLALQRAQVRCQDFKNVAFAKWDLRNDAVPGRFDLVVIMGVLEVFRSPLAIRRARVKLVDAMRPGGYLLLSNSRVPEWMESAWWSQAAVRGGTALDRLFCAHSSLQQVRTRSTDRFITSLFQNRS
jgi:2-polyprenyl-3-methyl-5-hydroxy-6-metoxy-1,4-benzoquinol methylase